MKRKEKMFPVMMGSTMSVGVLRSLQRLKICVSCLNLKGLRAQGLKCLGLQGADGSRLLSAHLAIAKGVVMKRLWKGNFAWLKRGVSR